MFKSQFIIIIYSVDKNWHGNCLINKYTKDNIKLIFAYILFKFLIDKEGDVLKGKF